MSILPARLIFLMFIVGQMVFKSLFTVSTSLDLDPPVVLSLISGVALLTMFTAGLVSWGAVRVRPLEVLRYE